MTTKQCRDCREEMPEENFYKYRSVCIICYGNRRRKPEGRGRKSAWSGFDDATRAQIKNDVVGGATLKNVAARYGVSYVTVHNWKKAGLFA